MWASCIQNLSFSEQIFRKLVIMNEHLLPWRRKKKRSSILRSRFLQDIIGKTLISSIKRRVDLNTSQKLLASVTIWHWKFHLYVQLTYMKISYLRKNTHLREDAAFLYFRLKESSENIFQLNGNMIFSVLLTYFRRTKVPFFMQCLS